MSGNYPPKRECYMEEITKSKRRGKRELKLNYNLLLLQKTHLKNIAHKRSQVSWADVQVESNGIKATNSIKILFFGTRLKR